MPEDFLQNSKLPEKLDLNDWIQFSLDSEEEIDRQIALEELASTGVPPYLTARIREISARDASSVCRQLALWIESVEKARIELKPQLKNLELSPINIIMLLENADASLATVLIQMLRKAPPEEILDQWRHGIKTEKNPRMLQVGLTLLGKFGRAEDAAGAVGFLEHADSEVVCSALSLLLNQDSELFKQQVRKGLTSKSFKIQLHAVHLLRSIDLEEAIQYIQAFLFSKNPLIRQKALRELMLVPFDRVSQIFLQYLSREIQALLLVKAGFVIAFNPLPDFPLKLFDIFQFSRDAKKHILQMILKQLVESIQSAGVLKQTFEEYTQELKQKINFKRSELVIRCALKDLGNSDKNMRLSAVDRLAPYCEYPSITQALARHLQNEADEEVKASIEAITGGGQVLPQVVDKSLNEVQDFIALGPKEQRGFLRQIRTNEGWHENRNLLSKLLGENLKKNVQLEIIRLFGQFGSRIDTGSVVSFIDDQDPSIVAAAIKTVGTIDLDVMLPHINRFLAHEDPRIKSAALEVYVLADKEGAIQYLSSMLRSTALPTRRVGLSLLPQLDYSSAEPLIWRLLKYEGNNELKIQAAYMVAANPTKEGLYKLFAISHKKEGELKEGYEDLWNLALVSAESLFATSRENVEAECWEAFKADSERKIEDKSAYSYSSVVGEADILGVGAEEADKTFIETLYLHLLEFKTFYAAGLLIFMPVMYYLFSSEPETKVTVSKTGKTAKVNFMPTQKSMSTQVGSEDWKGTLKSGARELLSGKGYQAALSNGAREIQSFRADYDRNYQQYLIDKANDSSEPEETRQLYEAHLNPAFANAVKAWEAENYSEAELYYERAVEDQQLNPVGRCFALQKLLEIAQNRKDKTTWLKWQDRLMKELKKIPGYEGVKGIENFGQMYIRMVEISQHLKGGGDSAPITNHLMKTGESEAEARESLEALKNIDKLFPTDR
jgi:HEAT repeat protein